MKSKTPTKYMIYLTAIVRAFFSCAVTSKPMAVLNRKKIKKGRKREKKSFICSVKYGKGLKKCMWTTFRGQI